MKKVLTVGLVVLLFIVAFKSGSNEKRIRKLENQVISLQNVSERPSTINNEQNNQQVQQTTEVEEKSEVTSENQELTVQEIPEETSTDKQKLDVQEMPKETSKQEEIKKQEVIQEPKTKIDNCNIALKSGKTVIVLDIYTDKNESITYKSKISSSTKELKGTIYGLTVQRIFITDDVTSEEPKLKEAKLNKNSDGSFSFEFKNLEQKKAYTIVIEAPARYDYASIILE